MLEKLGIGIDIVDISKFEAIDLNKNLDFYQTIFLPSEIDYCIKFDIPYERFAGKFAIKEATIKSINEKISMIDIETFHHENKPTIKIKKLNQKYNFLVSLSHDNKTAIAVVVSEKI